jgi:uncharacterized protein GlcG (DUF336 family)
VVQAALAKATEMNVLMDIAVVDAGANLKAFARMDGAWLGSIDIASKKARTARFFNLPTGVLGELSQPGGPLYQIEVSNGGLIAFPGGVPLLASDGTIIGGIGVSGSTVEDDHAVATAGAAPEARIWRRQKRPPGRRYMHRTSRSPGSSISVAGRARRPCGLLIHATPGWSVLCIPSQRFAIVRRG